MIYLAPIVIILVALVLVAMIVLPLEWVFKRGDALSMVIVTIYMFILLYFIVLSALIFN